MFVSKDKYNDLHAKYDKALIDRIALKGKLEAERGRSQELYWENYTLRGRLAQVEKLVDAWRDNGGVKKDV
jgi:hypothetical protein